MSDDQLKYIFSYHRPHGDQAARYEQLRAGGLVLAQLINSLAPDSSHKTVAIRRVQEAVMYANAAIAITETPPANSPAPQSREERIDIALRDVIACFDSGKPSATITVERVEAWKAAL